MWDLQQTKFYGQVSDVHLEFSVICRFYTSVIVAYAPENAVGADHYLKRQGWRVDMEDLLMV